VRASYFSPAAASLQRIAGGATGGGRPLSPAERADFEPRFQRDLGDVRLHEGTDAAHATSALAARAFTLQRDVYVGEGQYRSGTADGRRLLAHELTHVVQQESGRRAPAVQRWVTLQNAAAKATHGGLSGTRASIFEGWLNTLCPAGKFTVDAGSGEVNVPTDSICLDQVFDPAKAAKDPKQTSCRCACDAWGNLGEGRTYLYIEPQITLPAKTKGATPDRSLAQFGGAVTITASSGTAADFTIQGPTIVTTGAGNVSLEGAGDPHSKKAGQVSTPPWLVFAHEYCGHVQASPTSPNEHLQTREGNRTAVDVENAIRKEQGFGQRRGSFVGGQGRASVWPLQTGDTLAVLEDRFGVTLRGRVAWEPDGTDLVHKNLFSVQSGAIGLDAATVPAKGADAFLDKESDALLTRARASEGGDVVIKEIAWDDVRDKDTWTSIAQRWSVAARGGRTGAKRVEQANDGLPGLTKGGRVVIPKP